MNWKILSWMWTGTHCMLEPFLIPSIDFEARSNSTFLWVLKGLPMGPFQCAVPFLQGVQVKFWPSKKAMGKCWAMELCMNFHWMKFILETLYILKNWLQYILEKEKTFEFSETFANCIQKIFRHAEYESARRD